MTTKRMTESTGFATTLSQAAKEQAAADAAERAAAACEQSVENPKTIILMRINGTGRSGHPAVHGG